MKTLLAAVDFSASSLNAADYAADLAVYINADLVLLNVVQVPLSVSEVPMPEPVFEEIVEVARQDMDKLSEKLALRTRGRIRISTEVQVGTMAHEMEEMIGEKEPLAILLGMKSVSKAERFFIGSNALYAIRHLSCPVLVVPEKAVFNGVRKIGLACDLENVQAAIPFHKLKELLSAFHARLDILYVSKSDKRPSPDISGSLSLQNHLNAFHPEFHFLSSDKVAQGVNNFVKENGLDLLIILPQKHGFLDLFEHKYSKEIIESMQAPVVSIR
jgi:nucleotide-binding universal stress UspA family protein